MTKVSKTYPNIPVKQWKKLREQFQKSIPGTITLEYLAKNLKLKEESAKNSVFIPLSQIGLIDKKGKTNQELANKFRDNKLYPKFCDELIKKVYPQELLDNFPDKTSDKEELISWFKSKLIIGDKGAKRIATFYSHLIESNSSNSGVDVKNRVLIIPSIVKDTRGYIVNILYQINGCYKNGYYDACAVMVRRLIETLIIEVYEHQNIEDKIKKNDDFITFGDMISVILSESKFNLSRNVKKALPKIKDLGDKAAHTRRYKTHPDRIEEIQSDLILTIQELLYLAKLN